MVVIDDGLLVLPPELQIIKEYWRLFVAFVRPWIVAPVGDVATKIAALRGHNTRRGARLERASPRREEKKVQREKGGERKCI